MASSDEFDVGDRMRRWRTNLENPDGALNAIGAMMVAESQQAFRDQSWDGEKWPPRRVPNVMGVIADFAAGKTTPRSAGLSRAPRWRTRAA